MLLILNNPKTGVVTIGLRGSSMGERGKDATEPSF